VDREGEVLLNPRSTPRWSTIKQWSEQAAVKAGQLSAKGMDVAAATLKPVQLSSHLSSSLG